MKIFIESTPVFAERTGVAQYIKRLVDAATALDSKNQYTAFGFLFLGRKLKNTGYEDRPNLSYKFIRYFPGRVYTKLMKMFVAPPVDLLMGRKADVMLFLNYISWPTVLPTKKIVAVYDLSHLIYPQYTDANLLKFFNKFLKTSITDASHILTISENSKREIMHNYAVQSENISIIHPAVDHTVYYPRAAKEVSAVRNKYNLRKPYILSVATLEPRKNFVGLLRAYDTLPEEIKQRYGLVLTGAKGWLDDEINELYDKLSKKYDIIRTGYLPDEDLPALYSGASLFAYPTFYEGFGMPPLEAMACGTPVVTSNNSSLPEVVGDAAVMVEAQDTRAIAQAMERVLAQPKLSTELSKKGIVRAKEFTWEKSAAQLIELIDRVGGSR